MAQIKTHIRREAWMTETKYNCDTVCTLIYKHDEVVFASPKDATCGTCLRMWLFDAWKTGRLVEKNAAKATKKPKKPAAKAKFDTWTCERVNRLYDLPENIPTNGPHRGEPHEWEFDEEEDAPPSCLACNVDAEDVETGKE